MRWLLKRGRAEDAVEKFQSCVSMIPSEAESRSFRFALFERGINTLLEHGRIKSALALYHQMSVERLYASNGLRTKMLVCSSIRDAPHEPQKNLESLFNKLSPILSLPKYSQRSLRDLLDVMKYHPLVDQQFVSKLVNRHIDSRGSMYKLELETLNKLVSFYAHVGSLDAAEGLVASRRDPSSRPRPPVLYTTLMSSLAGRGSLSSHHFNSLLDKMKQSRVPVDLPFLNALIQWAVRNGNYHQAFALYKMILQDEAPHMIPDSFTLGSLFSAHQRLLTIRSPSLRRARQPRNAPTPRQLFRQMLECRVLAGQAVDPRIQPVVRVSTLNVALRLFMLAMDYPAAFVTLRTFYALGLRPDARSYRFVLTILFAHIRRAIREAQADQHQHEKPPSWAVNFLGGSSTAAQAVGGGAKPEQAHMPLEFAYALLEFGRGVNTGYRTPTIPVMLGDEEARGKAEWDVEPLERLVAKAILASLVPRDVRREEAERALRAKLAPYFQEMMPEKLLVGRGLRR